MKKLGKYSVRITLIYFSLGIIWISASDYILDFLVVNKATLSKFQSYKGWFYVTVTTFLLYAIISRYERLLKQHIRQLKRANHDLKTFLYKSSHDLKGPVASIQGLANLFKIENPVLKSSPIIEKIEESCSKSEYIIQDLGKLADLWEEGRMAESSMVNLEVIFDEIVDKFLKNKLITDNVVISKDIQVGNFYSDQYLLQIVLEKILENSFGYQTFESDVKKVRVSARSYDSYILISVEDSELWIEGDHINDVFEMFFKGSEHAKGNGLELYFAKLALEKLGGQIKILTAPEKSTRITISLPYHKRKRRIKKTRPFNALTHNSI